MSAWHDLQRLRQVRRGACGARGAEQQRHAELARAVDDEPQVAPRHRLRRRQLAGAEVVRPHIDRAHVAADEMRRPRKSRAQRRLRDAVSELAGGRERAQRLPRREAGIEQLRDDARHSTTSSSGRCCCAP
jgi:hypothetical protein